MKKTLTINISGTIFHIEEDAYEALQKYMVILKNYFGKDDEGNEIFADIEARIAEIFTEKTGGKNQAVTLDWVEELIETLGTPENFSEEAGEEEPLAGQKSRKRKLYRDPEQTVIAGVCGGLAAYFNMDPVVIRLIVVLLVLVTSGAGLLVYIILWIIVPKAVTTTQRLEMQGEEVTVKNIEKFLKDEVDAVKESYKKMRKSSFFSRKKS
ncbi:PspC domain-containing protein [Draconibacterium halophilum]|uniref:PspC domain-containing protein n=1 Tax=Draconibacterium halophilum TaxID=2706887 RepID=A0A6C0RFP9_9BACT|nr:PspC domain-containing protein [Draconibacterium halophilum]QIA09344.1 PspC domain-containing protein [Draconibacterium halophilum]